METDSTDRAGSTPPRRSFGRTLILFLIGVGILLGVSTGILSLLPDEVTARNNRIALVEVRGMITDSREVVRQLLEYKDDQNVRGIILRIDSPGGAVAPSQEIYSAVLKVRKSQKKIFASLGSVAASGGYYIASPADYIFANPGTLTGSIGVIMAFSNVQELIGKIGIRPEIIKSGKFKDAGSPVRPISKEERKLLQNLVDDVHQQFIQDVAQGRNLPVGTVKSLADGRIFTGRQALEMKMVDQLGGLQDTIDLLAEQAGIQGRPKIIQEEKSLRFLDWLLQASIARKITESLDPSSFSPLQYLWKIQ